MFTKNREQVQAASKGKYSSIKGLYNILPISTRNHMDRVAKYGESFYRYLLEVNRDLMEREFGVSFEQYARDVFCYHDIGRSFIPVEILNKVEKLTDEEMQKIRNHTSYSIFAIEQTYVQPFPDQVMILLLKTALYHHERYDGKGYPKGLKEEEIPFCARVCALVDTLDGITSWKPYKAKQTTKEVAVMIMEKDRGTQFDPWLFDRFKEWIEIESSKELKDNKET